MCHSCTADSSGSSRDLLAEAACPCPAFLEWQHGALCLDCVLHAAVRRHQGAQASTAQTVQSGRLKPPTGRMRAAAAAATGGEPFRD